MAALASEVTKVGLVSESNCKVTVPQSFFAPEINSIYHKNIQKKTEACVLKTETLLQPFSLVIFFLLPRNAWSFQKADDFPPLGCMPIPGLETDKIALTWNINEEEFRVYSFETKCEMSYLITLQFRYSDYYISSMCNKDKAIVY